VDVHLGHELAVRDLGLGDDEDVRADALPVVELRRLRVERRDRAHQAVLHEREVLEPQVGAQHLGDRAAGVWLASSGRFGTQSGTANFGACRPPM
jgi:hypothetical protein